MHRPFFLSFPFNPPPPRARSRSPIGEKRKTQHENRETPPTTDQNSHTDARKYPRRLFTHTHPPIRSEVPRARCLGTRARSHAPPADAAPPAARPRFARDSRPRAARTRATRESARATRRRERVRTRTRTARSDSSRRVDLSSRATPRARMPTAEAARRCVARDVARRSVVATRRATGTRWRRREGMGRRAGEF